MSDPGTGAPERPEPELLTEPRDGTPDVVTDPAVLRRTAEAIAAGHGPIAVDTERASGYRYSQRAYLVQVRREGAGTALIDPIALDGQVGPLVEALTGPEWVLHAASQDLHCLAELELRPSVLFDTELAGRLAGYDRVALGTMVENLLGYRLEKGHGAADWSRRPLPRAWLDYAALDVELLVQLREVLIEDLRGQGKLDWALEEFEALRTATPAPPRKEPWRRTSGVHRARNPRALAAVRALWQERDALARQRDIAPGRVLPDSAIMQAATSAPKDEQELLALPVFGGRAQRKVVGTWMRALRTAAELNRADLPAQNPPHDGPPPANRWADKDPDAAARLSATRAALAELAETRHLPVENLLQPDLMRRTCWEPPEDLTPDGIGAVLRAGGAREWQIALVADTLSRTLKVAAEPAPED